MSETSDTESSCGWTILSHEGSDIETLGTEVVEDVKQPLETEQQDTVTCCGAGCGKEVDALDVTLVGTTTTVEADVNDAGNEHVSILSSSDHSDILTLGDVKDDEQITAEATEELYLGTSCSSQYTFITTETALMVRQGKPFQSLINLVLPVQQLVMPNASSSEDESDPSSGAVVRRRRMRRNTLKTEGEDFKDSDPSETEKELGEERESETVAVSQSSGSSILNKCTLLALIIAISMGFGHFYGTTQIQERQKSVEKIKVNELDGLRGLVHRMTVQRDDLTPNNLDLQKAISILSEEIDKIIKENEDLSVKNAQIQARKSDLEAMLNEKAVEKRQIESQKQKLMTENHQLKHLLEKEEKSMLILQEELKALHLKIKDLEAMGVGADSLLSENQRLKAELEKEKQVIRSFSGKREGLIGEAQTLRKMLDKEQKVTEELRKRIKIIELRQHMSGAEKEASLGQKELKSRLMEMEKKLSFEQQRSDLWERLYLETKEERAKGDSEPKMSTPRPKQGMAGKVKETFDAVKNSTKEFVHHHKEQIKKAKEAVKENLRKFSDSVKSTFKNFKDSASTIFNKARGFYDKRQDNKNMHESWRHRPNRPKQRPPFKCDVFKSNHCTRKATHKVDEDPVETDRKFKPKSCSGVFDCAYQESMSLFNKATEPIRADEFYQLLQSYLQQEVDHFHQWKELEMFINNFFHNGMFIHDQMLFTDFVNHVEDYLIDMYKNHGLNENFFKDLDDYIYRHFFGETYYKNYSPSGPFEDQSREDLRGKHRRKQQKSRNTSERKWTRSDQDTDRHMADVKIELGPMPFDPKY